MTEKLLLSEGAIHISGSVKGRKATRHATSDWMDLAPPPALAKRCKDEPNPMNPASAVWNAYQDVDAPAYLANYRAELQVAQEQWRDIQFHPMREHAGLVARPRIA